MYIYIFIYITFESMPHEARCTLAREGNEIPPGFLRDVANFPTVHGLPSLDHPNDAEPSARLQHTLQSDTRRAARVTLSENLAPSSQQPILSQRAPKIHGVAYIVHKFVIRTEVAHSSSSNKYTRTRARDRSSL